jgi:hypothetical protein
MNQTVFEKVTEYIDNSKNMIDTQRRILAVKEDIIKSLEEQVRLQAEIIRTLKEMK